MTLDGGVCVTTASPPLLEALVVAGWDTCTVVLLELET